MPQEQTIYSDNYQIYKPTAKGTGGALALQFSDRGIFLTIARQLGTQRQFDWKPATTLYLNLVDISKILNLFHTRKEVEIFHDPSLNNPKAKGIAKSLKISWHEQYGHFYWQVWEKAKDQSKNAAVPVTVEESLIIETLLKWAIPYLLKWQIPDTAKGDIQEASGPVPESQVEAEVVPPAVAQIFPNTVVVPNTPAKAPQTKDEKLALIMQMAKTKLGAKNPADAKAKIIAKTGFAFTEENLDKIIADLNNPLITDM